MNSKAALGMLVMGRLVWLKLLVLIHNKRTIRKYEEILGISVRDFPEEGPLAHKSAALEFATKKSAILEGRQRRGQARRSARAELSGIQYP
jgi:hypothetical protein